MEEDYIRFKITCQQCNGFAKFKHWIALLIYITFICEIFPFLGIYSEEIDPENLYFQWPVRIKMQQFYYNLLREGNGDQKYLI